MGQTAHRIPAELFTAAQIMVGGKAVDSLYIGNTQVFGGAPATPSYLTGGVVTDVGGYRYHTFNTSGTLTFVDGDGPVPVEYLVVAGGGGASFGGGGAGGLRSSTVSLGANQTVTIGAGGSAGTGAGAAASSGSTSSLGSLVATGGGYGATAGPPQPSRNGGPGGSGGGATAPASGFGGSGGAATPGQGYKGGDSTVNASPGYPAGGGGGAGAAGADAAASGAGPSGAGGSGAEWPTGSGTRYAGGGGAGNYNTTVGYASGGGLGGGGRGGYRSQTGESGAVNTGGGGGGAGDLTGGVGGSGTVIVRYTKKTGMPDPPPFDPSHITGLVGWWDAADAATIIATGSNVTEWRDKSTNLFHLNVKNGTVATGTRTMNGRNAIDFIPIGNLVTSKAYTAGQPVTIFAVFKADTLLGVGNNYVVGLNGAVAAFDGFWAMYAGGVVKGTAADTNPHVSAAIYQGATSQLWIDGVSNVIGNAGTGPVGPVTVGGPNASSWPWDGLIAEVVLYNWALTTTERQQVEAYLKTKWGTP